MTIYKEMKYQRSLPGREKLAEGSVDEYKWMVISFGTHPCGYVSVPRNHPFYDKDYWDIDDRIRVHGGLTYSGKMGDSNDFWFGWDYAHADDYTYLSTTGDKRWTTQEIVDECLDVIQQFQSYEGEK